MIMSSPAGSSPVARGQHWIPARIPPPAVGPLPGHGAQHLRGLPQVGHRRRRPTEQITLDRPQQGHVIGCQQPREGIAAQMFHAASMAAYPVRQPSHPGRAVYSCPRCTVWARVGADEQESGNQLGELTTEACWRLSELPRGSQPGQRNVTVEGAMTAPGAA